MLKSSPPNFTTATVGKKVLMAVTGIDVIGFVVIHLIGNLQIFIGQEQLNNYAKTLQNMGALKWAFRIFIATVFLIHIWKGIVLWLENKKARPVSYSKNNTIEASLSSRTMIYTGALTFFFVAYHLMHFTLLTANPEYQTIPLYNGQFDVYSMIIMGFSEPVISVLYIVFVALVGFHLSHAFSSFFQTLGLNNTTIMPKLKLFSNLFGTIIFLAYASIPVAVLTQIITLPGGGF